MLARDVGSSAGDRGVVNTHVNKLVLISTYSYKRNCSHYDDYYL